MPSKNQNSISTKSLLEAYKKLNINPKKFSFLERGSDERQFNWPNVDIELTSIFRSKYGHYKEIHTSLDNFQLVTLKGINGGFKVAKKAIQIMMNKLIPISTTICEPNLSKRKLYPTLSLKENNKKNKEFINAKKLINILMFADGKKIAIQLPKYVNLKIKNLINLLNY